jgi:DNA-binding GntR family transcriptional regulator
MQIPDGDPGVENARKRRRSNAVDVSGIAPLPRADEDGLVTIPVYRHVRDAILTGQIPPGGIISQVELSRRLGVSRTPLREALRRLEQEGLVEAAPNRRARVRSYAAEELELVYTQRIFIEALAIALSVPELTKSDFDAVDQSLKEMSAASEANEHAAWEEAHRRFHRGLISRAPENLHDLVESYAARAVLVVDRRLYESTVSRGLSAGPAEHQEILEACRSRDAARASILLARHLSITAISVITQVMPEHNPVSIRTALRLMTGADARSDTSFAP